jgi:glucoamylase
VDERTTPNTAAFGAPGMPPKWARSAKDGVGTAYAASSRIWFTVWNGVLTEIYYPTVDRPQTRDLQYLITDGSTFFHEEKLSLSSQTERFGTHGLGYRITNSDPEGRYTIVKDVIADPHVPCVLQNTILNGDPEFVSQLKLYALCAPHLEIGGWGNNAHVTEIAGRRILVAEKHGTWLALAADVPFLRTSCGYVGSSDGWTDLANNFVMDWEFESADDGNVALTGELDLSKGTEFTLGLAFGDSLHSAANHLLQSLATPFDHHRDRYVEQWKRAGSTRRPLDDASKDHGDLYQTSFNVLLAHEDKKYPGAFIASLSIPWGEVRSDDDLGGYHLVWTRDLVYCATGLLAAGDLDTPLRAGIYLATSQQADGGFAQNFWLDGTPHWTGIQLDEVALPILLAWQLDRADALLGFDPYPGVLSAAAYLIRHGPVTGQERWEEASGLSPSTLAVSIAALVCAACFARRRGDEDVACFLETHAVFLESHLEEWTVTTEGTLHPDLTRHYIRINPAEVDDPHSSIDPNRSVLSIANLSPDSNREFPAKDIVDPGFLELVRYGIRKPDDQTIVDSVEVVDRVLKVETPYGPCWHRYNHDGYGQRPDGGPFESWGQGRAWPLLTGERGHYELAAGRKAAPYLRTMENLASSTGLLPEQAWDEADRPEIFMRLGRPTGSAMPLMWAHAEYIKLLRSAHQGVVFDFIPEVAARYLGSSRSRTPIEVWKPSWHVDSVRRGQVFRVVAQAQFQLRWSFDNWATSYDARSTSLLGLCFFNISVPKRQEAPLQFEFRSMAEQRSGDGSYSVEVKG